MRVCEICGKEISRYSKLCRSCAVAEMKKRHWRKRKPIKRSPLCSNSPTNAHWWVVDEGKMTCKFCGRTEKVKMEEIPKTF